VQEAIVVVIPTLSPTEQPVPDPTEAPVETTVSPTESPTRSLSYTTENKYDADLDSTIRQSQCPFEPPVIQFVQSATFVYRYEVSRLEESVDTETTDEEASMEVLSQALGSGMEELSAGWTESLHDELAREFMICEGYDYDAVWILQSKPHVVDETTPCAGAADETATDSETPNDEDSNDFSACVSVLAETRVIAYQSPLGQKATKQLWSESTYGEGEAAERFALDAIGFLEDRLNSGDGGLGFSPTYGITYKGGEIVEEVVPDSSGGDEEVTESDGDESEPETDNEDESTDDATATDDAGSLWADPSGGTAVGIEASNNGSAPGGIQWTPGMIAAVAAVGSAALLIVIMAAINRRNREPREDEEYLRDYKTPRSDAHFASSPVDHLDLDSDDGNPDLERNAATSPSSHRGRKYQQSRNPLSPLHFHFSGFAGSVMSPSSKERAKMGPLGLADEFRQQKDWADDSATGTHRGGVGSNSSSGTGTHRGIVSNSSSMSSNLPPPHQNSSPRLYQLRDTIKL